MGRTLVWRGDDEKIADYSRRPSKVICMNFKTFHRSLAGRIVDLVPLDRTHTPDVVQLRNSPHVRQFFDEKDLTTVESQNAFFEKYSGWPDDLYWAVVSKSGKVIGTNRINAIDGESGCKGSLIIDQNEARLGPYALEAELLLLNFAFNVLGVKRIKTIVRPDNIKMIGLNTKLGFRLVGPYDQRGVMNNEYMLERQDYRSEEFDLLINHFAGRAR